MRTLILLGLVVTFGCSKRNPDLCCTDPADCMAHGIPDGTSCKDGLVCRGNQCIAEDCTTSAACEASAPYCVSGLCGSTCMDDSQCPGFGQDTADKFCSSGSCVQCRANMMDCPANAPVCDTGACRACATNGECASGACAPDGSCAAESDIAFVSPSGSSASDCSRSSPCTLGRGLTMGRPFVELAAGTYSNPSTLTISGSIAVIGAGAAQTILTNSSTGPVISIGPGSDVSFDALTITGARTGSNTGPYGYGLECPDVMAGSRAIRLHDVTISNNALAGLEARTCTVVATESTFSNNNGYGLELTDSTATVDRCMVTGNAYAGISFDTGLYKLTNTFVVRNGGGVSFFSQDNGNDFEFDTIVDNGSNIAGLDCNVSNATASMPNNIIARNSPNTTSTECTLPSSIVSTDVANLHFVSPDAAPYDYHLGPGSIAIDMGVLSSIDHDFDGDHRPQGSGFDIGADETK